MDLDNTIFVPLGASRSGYEFYDIKYSILLCSAVQYHEGMDVGGQLENILYKIFTILPPCFDKWRKRVKIRTQKLPERSGRVFAMQVTEKFEKGYKKYENTAREYLKRPEQTDSLLKDATKKAEDRKGSFTDIWDKLQLLFELVGAWRKGEYRKIPAGSIITIIAAIIYFVSPIDLVPDFLAGLGIVDDAAVIGFVLKQLSADLDKFKYWKENHIAENIILEEKLTP